MKYIATSKPIKVENVSHDQWLENRKSGIGSSEIATIVGLNPYETPYQLWLRKTGQIKPKEENFFMKAGHYLEDAVSRFYEDESGRKVINRSAAEDIYIHPNFDWARVSPDRMFWRDAKRSGDNKGILECKTTQREIDGDNLPPFWFTQIQYQLGVMNRLDGSLAWLSAGRSFDYRDIVFVPDYFEWMMGEAERFYVDNIVGGKEPPLTNAEDVLIKYPTHTVGAFTEASGGLVNEIESLKKIKAKIKELEGEKERIEDTVKLTIGEAEALNYQGSVLATYKAPKAGKKFDEKAFKSAHPDLHSAYSKDVQGARRLLIK